MPQKYKTIFALAVVIIGLTVFTSTLVHAVWYAPEPSNYSLATTTPKPVVSIPKEDPSQLVIPALNIDAHVQYVGVNAKGNLGVPNNFTDVAWYKDGVAPGQVGSAVIDGHVDNGLGLDGVFKHLADIKVGDAVYVRTKEGRDIHFIVSDIESYPYQSVPTGAVFANTGVPRLVLITCEGAWVQGDRTYDHRLVVYATLASSQ